MLSSREIQICFCQAPENTTLCDHFKLKIIFQGFLDHPTYENLVCPTVQRPAFDYKFSLHFSSCSLHWQSNFLHSPLKVEVECCMLTLGSPLPSGGSLLVPQSSHERSVKPTLWMGSGIWLMSLLPAKPLDHSSGMCLKAKVAFMLCLALWVHSLS